MQKWIILIFVVIILIITTIIVLNINVETEYTPEIEVEESDLRKTIISLYFKNSETGEITKESRLVDSKILLIDPYEEIVNMLLVGPEGENLEKYFSEDTKLIEASLIGDCLTLNFNEHFLDNIDSEDEQNNAIQSIYESFKEFTEINSVKILVNNNEIS